jgi:hypothetical protein
MGLKLKDGHIDITGVVPLLALRSGLLEEAGSEKDGYAHRSVMAMTKKIRKHQSRCRAILNALPQKGTDKEKEIKQLKRLFEYDQQLADCYEEEVSELLV